MAAASWSDNIISSDAERRAHKLTKNIVFVPDAQGRQFTNTPKVLCWFSGIDLQPDPTSNNKIALSVAATEVSTAGFACELETFVTSQTRFLTVQWVAFPRAVASGDDGVLGAVYRRSDPAAAGIRQSMQ